MTAIPNDTQQNFEDFKKCVTFIFIKSEQSKLKPNGTGFIIGIPYEGEYFPYLVTAKHVLLDDTGKYFPEIYVRFNNIDTHSADVFKIKIEENNEIFLHKDPAIDIALVKFILPNLPRYDFIFLPHAFILDKETINKKLYEGIEIFFIGLFYKYFGKGRNQPLVRFGRLSSLPNEKIPVNKINESEKSTEAYLCECHSIGGFSGSPVFFYYNELINGEEYKMIYLLGIMSGHYPEITGITLENIKNNFYRELNSGIGLVMPVYFISDIINQPYVVQRRQNHPEYGTIERLRNPIYEHSNLF